MAALQLITRCLEVTPVYTHIHLYKHPRVQQKSFATLLSKVRRWKKKKNTRIHSCGLILSVDSVLSFMFRWESRWRMWKIKAKPPCWQRFATPSIRGSVQETKLQVKQRNNWCCKTRTWFMCLWQTLLLYPSIPSFRKLLFHHIMLYCKWWSSHCSTGYANICLTLSERNLQLASSCMSRNTERNCKNVP